MRGNARLVSRVLQSYDLKKMAGVLLLIVTVCMRSTAKITGPPSPVVSPLYKLADFTCGGVGDRLTWTIQGFSLSYEIKQYREISVTTNNISADVWSSVLTIRALPINNGIIIGCNILRLLPALKIDQKGALLTVEG